jgi:hypothetical protein
MVSWAFSTSWTGRGWAESPSPVIGEGLKGAGEGLIAAIARRILSNVETERFACEKRRTS